MRGNQDEQEEVFSYIPLEQRVPRIILCGGAGDDGPGAARAVVLVRPVVWATGRPSIPPEQLLRAQILQALYTIRSERQLMDQIDGNWRYRWFVGLKVDDAVWDVTVFNQESRPAAAGRGLAEVFRAGAGAGRSRGFTG